MTHSVAIQMDPVATLKPATDSTLVLGLEAQRRGHRLAYYTPDALSLENGKLSATARPLTLFDDREHHYEEGEPFTLDLESVDVVLMRQDPPFHMGYITACLMLEKLSPRTLVANNPASVRNNPEKWLPLSFPDFLPPTLISRDMARMEAFIKEHQDVVVKPLYGFSGHDVIRVQSGDDVRAKLQGELARNPDPLIAQRFLPEITKGDTRLMFVDGDYKGALSRVPAAGSFLSGLRTGATAVKTVLSKRQEMIVAPLSTKLKELGILFAGVDMIGDYLIEINITCPTLLRAYNALYNTHLERGIWDAIERRISR